MQAGLVNSPVEKSAPATASCDGDIEAALVEPAGAMISHSAYHAAAFSRRQQVELIRFGAVGSSNDPSSGAGVRARAYPADYDESDSDNESDDSSSTSTSDGAGADSGGGTQGTAPQRTFETFEVEEQSTEIKVLKSILEKKEEEVEHLRSIIKQLSLSRQRAQRTKVELEEQYAALQKEYMRVAKVAEYARTVSAQSVSRSSKQRQELRDVQDRLRRTQRDAERQRERARRLKGDNEELRKRVAMLEKLAMGNDCRLSVSQRELLYAHQVSLY